MIYSGHIPYKKKSKSRWKPIVFFTLILSILGFLFWLNFDDLFYNDRDKFIKSSFQRISQKFEKNTLEIKDIYHFIETVKKQNQIEKNQTQNYLFLSYAYFFIFSQKGLSKENIMEASYYGLTQFLELKKQSKSEIKKIYGNLLKAFSIDPKLEKNESYIFLKIFSEFFLQRKNPDILFSEFKKIEEKNIDSTLLKTYFWTNIILHIQLGNLENLNFLTNSISNLDFTEREKLFLLGMNKFYLKEYIPAVNFLRKISYLEKDFLSISSKLLLAKIFYIQNLPNKSIEILEEIYDDAVGRESEISFILKELKEKYPNIKTKIQYKNEN